MHGPVFTRVARSTSTTRCSTTPASPPGHRPLAAGALAAATTAALVLTGAPAASADGAPSTTVVADGLVGPLSLDVSPRGDVVVAQSLSGVLTRLDRRGGRTDLVSLGGPEVAGVSAASAGGVLYTHYVPEDPEAGTDGVALLERVDRRGRVDVLADLGEHERTTNPDADVVYGLRDTDQKCLDQAPEGFPGRYPGIVESHPYATASLGGGRTVVADAAGNDVLSVDARGRVTTIAVLPPQPAVLSREVVVPAGLPECLVGETYWFEPVPTDVEVGPDRALYVSLLPGGPEDPSVGARGSVVRVDPRTGDVETVLSGLLGATGVAVGHDGTVYATELFGGRVVALAPGATSPATVLEAELPAAVEVHRGDLYVTTQVLPPEDAAPDGRVVRVDL